MIVNISGYQFIELKDLEQLKEQFLMFCKRIRLLGTVLLSHEGLNVMMAGTREQIDQFVVWLHQDARFSSLVFKESFSDTIPFKRLRIRIKKEIITLGVDTVDAVHHVGQHLPPLTFKQWMDEGKDMLVLDTRNDYEVEFGTFKDAINPHIQSFSQFPAVVDQLDPSLKEKPVVMFCTGGVRCEKASLLMEQKGFKHVYQIEGGILKYFEACQGAHWEGDCFVFDERVALNPQLQPTGAAQCYVCGEPVNLDAQQLPTYIPSVCCPKCVNNKSFDRNRREGVQSESI